MAIKRDNAQRRKPGRRQARSRVLVVCCGAKTEKLYLDGMRLHFRDSPVAVVVRPDDGAPSQLVTYATKVWERDRDGFDEVWCVFDVDEFGADVDAAVVAARRADVSLAISNPCFEFWLILHFKDHCAWLRDFHAAKAALCRHVRDYDKTKLTFDAFAPGIPDAIDRARKLTDSGKDHHDNPSTTMWRLAEIIVGNS